MGMVKIMQKTRVIPVVSELKIGYIKILFFFFISVAENLYPLVQDDYFRKLHFVSPSNFTDINATVRIELDNILESYSINFHF